MDFKVGPTGTGGKVLPETDPDKRMLAEHVGFVVMQAAELDMRLAALTDIVSSHDSELKLQAWGRSGDDLVKRLRAIEPSTPEVVGFADRYANLYKIRNQVVHSVRMNGNPDADTDVTLKPLKQKANEPVERLHDPLKLGVPQLIDLWHEMRDFDHEAWRLFIDHFVKSKYAVKWGSSEQSPEQ